MVQKCVICIKNPATDTPIRWSGRKGFICEACLEKSWNAPIVPVYFTQVKTKATNPVIMWQEENANKNVMVGNPNIVKNLSEEWVDSFCQN